MTRAERAQRAAALKAQGLTVREIADRMGLSKSYTRSFLADPAGVKDAERKRRARRPCPDCGVLVWPKSGAVARCAECSSMAGGYFADPPRRTVARPCSCACSVTDDGETCVLCGRFVRTVAA